MYYKDCQVAIVVYDITNKSSFEVLKEWVKELENYGPRHLLIALVGNKIDLNDQMEVTNHQAKKLAKQLKAVFQLTSCKFN